MSGPDDDPWGDPDAPALASGEWGAPDEDAPGAPRYHPGALLGRGGMGEVHAAEDPRLRRQVALKRARADGGPAAQARLRREARITAALDHPGIVPVLDAGEDTDGRPWYAMRLVRGRSLAEALAQAPDAAARRALVPAVLAAARALAHAHGRGIVHRDLKPDNIVLGPHGEVQVLDWGLARPLAEEARAWDAVLSRADATAAGALLGTPAYMAPEQAAGGEAGRPADVWALGLVLHEVLGGRRAFPGDSEAAVLRAVLHEDLPPLPADTPAPLVDVVQRATRRDPATRMADAGAFAAALQRALAAPPAPPPRRHTGLVLGAVALGLLLLLVGLWRRDPAPPDPDREALAQALVAQARAAARAGARPEAETLAAHALQIREDPEARGLLLSAAPRPTLAETWDRPEGCVREVLAPDGGTLLCVGEDDLALVDLATRTERWRQPQRLPDAAIGPGGRIHGRQLPDPALRVLDPRDGAAASEAPVVPASAMRTGASAHPDQLVLHAGGSWLKVDFGAGTVVERDGMPVVDTAAVTPTGGVVWTTEDRLFHQDADGTDHPARPLGARARGLSALPNVIAAAPDGASVLLGYLDGWVEHRRLSDGAVLEAVQVAAGMIDRVAFSPGGGWHAAVDERGSAWTWPPGRADARLRLPGRVDALGFPAEGELVALADRIRRWTLPGAARPGRLLAPGGVANLDWAEGGLAAALGTGAVRTWDGRLAPTEVLRSEGVVTKDVAVLADGRVASAALGGPPRIGPPDAPGTPQPATERGCRRLVRVDPDLLLCTPQRDGPVLFRPDGPGFPALRRIGMLLVDAEPAPDHRSAIALSADGEVLVVRDGDPPTVEALARVPGARAVALGPGGWSVALDDRVQHHAQGGVAWSAPTRTPLRDLVLTPDGGLLIGGERDGTTRIWDTADGTLRAVLRGHGERVQAVAVDPAGARLATGSWDESVRLWELGALDAAPAALLQTVEAAWGLDRATALSADPG